jgi:hypothetical protein
LLAAYILEEVFGGDPSIEQGRRINSYSQDQSNQTNGRSSALVLQVAFVKECTFAAFRGRY